MEYKQPTWKIGLAWIAVFFGFALLVASGVGFALNKPWLSGAPIGIGLLLPAVWWLASHSADKKAASEYAVKQHKREEILPLLSEEDQATVQSWGPFEPPTPTNKHMAIVLPIAALIAGSGYFFLPKVEEPTPAPVATTTATPTPSPTPTPTPTSSETPTPTPTETPTETPVETIEVVTPEPVAPPVVAPVPRPAPAPTRVPAPAPVAPPVAPPPSAPVAPAPAPSQAESPVEEAPVEEPPIEEPPAPAPPPPLFPPLIPFPG